VCGSFSTPPDGTDNYIFYEEILPSNFKTATWNLTSGNGLPTVKIPSAMQISYTISVEVRASNCPTELAEVEIIVDPPLLMEGVMLLCVPISSGVFVLIWFRKRWRYIKR